VFELEGRAFAFVVEGLGTKSIIARQVLERHGLNRFVDVAYDAVAAIVNDLACVGALPLVANAYFATGASDWYRDSLGAELRAGHEIVLLASSGLHANGASLARAVAGRLRGGYATPLPRAAPCWGRRCSSPRSSMCR